MLLFRDDARPLAALVHYACHPVIHAANAVCADFPGAATAELERRLGGDVVVGYLQGCAGDVNPRSVAAGEFVFGSGTEVDRLGRQLADAVEKALGNRPDVVTTGPISVERAVVELPVRYGPQLADLKRISNSSGVEREWARHLLARPAALGEAVTLGLTRVALGPRLGLLGMNMEPVGHYGRLVKDLSGGTVLPLGYTDGMTGYLVTADQSAEGGYEADLSTKYFGWPAPLAPEAQPVAEAAIAALLRSQRGRSPVD